MNGFNIYLTGVGGQGIGMISEVLMRAADHAGLKVSAVDTHGLAQRGGVVVSQIRTGEDLYSPLLLEGEADLAVSLERNEALRAAAHALKDGGTLIYYNTSWQPLPVRLGQAEEVSESAIEEYCRKRDINVIRVADRALEDVRMQNTVVLANVDKHGLIPGVKTAHYREAMADLLSGALLEQNIALFEKERRAG